jgi:hypothetical protein|uniref:RING-type domain-containing protein n=1 Tax=Castor canadensis TaxID=51338 RepID=A0A8C0XNF7_CASCN
MAGLASSSAIPVWLGEDDLSCIICHGLLVWPTTLPCGHSFCRDCLGKVWGAGGAGSPWACPTCREALAPRSRLRKNTLLEDLVDKYSRAARELEDAELAQSPAPGPGPAPDSAPDLASQHRPAQPRVGRRGRNSTRSSHCPGHLRGSLCPSQALGSSSTLSSLTWLFST